jgi:tRNA(Arg) A34 adenosine deaminase TadA
MKTDRSFLLHAVKLAAEGIETGAGPFAAVIVKEGKIIAEAVNSVVLTSDPTAHAEVAAIRKAASSLNTHDLKDCTIYCSCEPCPMCLGAIYWAGIRNVVYSCDRNDAAMAGFSDREIYDEILLDPSERKIGFLKIENTDGEEVFRKWEEYEKKIPY